MNILVMGIEQGKELEKAEGKVILKEWLLTAARVETVEEFADRAKIFHQAY